jgi:UDP-N-acetyl-D-galactosamine dehydrogenase
MEVVPERTVVSVVGLGYVGLPTALSFHKAGFIVQGIDVSTKVIKSLEKGIPPFVDEGVDLSIPLKSSRWKVSSDFASSIPESNIVLITVPTPVNPNKTPDLSFVVSASKSVLSNINREKKTIVVLESTVYPGVTRKELGKICNDLQINPAEELVLAYSPERINPGDSMHSASSVDRIVGCDNPEIGDYLARIYSRITSATSTYVGSIEVAEAAKLVENVQRDIDIAFVNELANILPRMNLDVEEVLSAASTKWNFHRHTPGIGVGGHCIPIDPYYYQQLSKTLGSPSKISPIAREINESMPILSAGSILNAISHSEEKRILILGYSYKPNTGDARETPVKYLAKDLSENECTVFVWDPHIEDSKFPDWVCPLSSPADCIQADIIVIGTAHDVCIDLDWELMGRIVPEKIVYDGRRALNPDTMSNSGWRYLAVGYPSKEANS